MSDRSRSPDGSVSEVSAQLLSVRTATRDPTEVKPLGAEAWWGLSPGFVREAAADRLKALAHPDRLRVVEALAGGPKSVSQIGAAIGRPMNVVSRNLRVLRDAKVVQCSKRGNSVLYVLSDRDVARLAGVAYRGASSQVRKVMALAPPPHGLAGPRAIRGGEDLA